MGYTYRTVFDALEAKFVVSAAHSAILIEKGEFGCGWPSVAFGMPEARDTLYAADTSLVVSDTIWATLIRYSRACPQRWQLAAIWMMLPSMRVIARRLYRNWGVEIEDIRSEVIIGFIEALRTVDPRRQKLAAALWWTTYRQARNMCARSAREKASPNIDNIAARSARTDSSTTAPADSTNAHVVSSTEVEGERLGSIARRMGLHRRIRDWRQSAATRRFVTRTARSAHRRPARGDSVESDRWGGAA